MSKNNSTFTSNHSKAIGENLNQTKQNATDIASSPKAPLSVADTVLMAAQIALVKNRVDGEKQFRAEEYKVNTTRSNSGKNLRRKSGGVEEARESFLAAKKLAKKRGIIGSTSTHSTTSLATTTTSQTTSTIATTSTGTTTQIITQTTTNPTTNTTTTEVTDTEAGTTFFITSTPRSTTAVAPLTSENGTTTGITITTTFPATTTGSTTTQKTTTTTYNPATSTATTTSQTATTNTTTGKTTITTTEPVTTTLSPTTTTYIDTTAAAPIVTTTAPVTTATATRSATQSSTSLSITTIAATTTSNIEGDLVGLGVSPDKAIQFKELTSDLVTSISVNLDPNSRKTIDNKLNHILKNFEKFVNEPRSVSPQKVSESLDVMLAEVKVDNHQNLSHSFTSLIIAAKNNRNLEAAETGFKNTLRKTFESFQKNGTAADNFISGLAGLIDNSANNTNSTESLDSAISNMGNFLKSLMPQQISTSTTTQQINPASETPAPEENQDDKNKIIGIAVGVSAIALVAIAVVLGRCFCLRKKRNNVGNAGDNGEIEMSHDPEAAAHTTEENESRRNLDSSGVLPELIQTSNQPNPSPRTKKESPRKTDGKTGVGGRI